MGWEANSIFQVVIIEGPQAGLFVYQGAPGPGNEPVFSVVAPGVTTDPYGNPVSAVLNAGAIPSAYTRIDASGNIQLFKSSTIRIVINPNLQAMLFYSPSLAAGNLVASISPAGGIDSPGNVFLPGLVSYVKITSADFRAVQHSSGGTSWWVAGSNAGPWNLVQSFQLQADEVGLGLFSNVNGNSVVFNEAAAAMEVTGLVEILTGGLSWAGGAAGDDLTLSTGTSAQGGLLQASNTTANPGSSPIVFFAASAADRLFALRITGASQPSLIFDSNGKMAWGSSSSPTDTLLYRSAAGILAVDGLVANVSGAGETWHDTGAMANAWSKAGGYFKYKFIAEANAVAISFQNLAPGTNADGTTIIAAANGLPAAYRPASNHRIPIYCDSLRVPVSPNNEAAAVVAITDGSFQCFGISTTATRCDLSWAVIPLDI